jgi:hypothetical protein
MPKDFRVGSRMLLKKRGFMMIAVLTLARGIGATSAVFSLIEWVLLSGHESCFERAHLAARKELASADLRLWWNGASTDHGKNHPTTLMAVFTAERNHLDGQILAQSEYPPWTQWNPSNWNKGFGMESNLARTGRIHLHRAILQHGIR